MRTACKRATESVSIPSSGIFVFLQKSYRCATPEFAILFQSRRAGFLFFYVVYSSSANTDISRIFVSIPSSGIFVFLHCLPEDRAALSITCFNPVERDFCFSTATCGGESSRMLTLYPISCRSQENIATYCHFPLAYKKANTSTPLKNPGGLRHFGLKQASLVFKLKTTTCGLNSSTLAKTSQPPLPLGGLRHYPTTRASGKSLNTSLPAVVFVFFRHRSHKV